MKRFTTSNVLIFMGYFLVITSRDAWAYLDPVGGSMIIQLLVGGAVSAFVMGKLYWKKLLSMVGIRREEDPEPGDDEQTEK